MATHVAEEGNFSPVSQLDSHAENVLKGLDGDEGFWIADMNRPRESLMLWRAHLAKVRPFYAIKCCDEPNLLKFLAARGCGFDCASENEIRQILKLDVDPSRIVFSHPIKNVAGLRYAKENGVSRLVFDTIDELKKILRYYPDAEVFLRIKPRFSNAVIQLSKKFGAEAQDVPEILKAAKDLGANFIGFSFHVGSLCDDITSFRTALQYVSELKRMAEGIDLQVRFIDIGGGFLPPNAPANNTFASVARGIQEAIEEYFDDEDIDFIAEPGRFISAEYMDLHLPVICVKEHLDDSGCISQSVYVPDGMYGSFNALSYDHAQPHFEIYSESQLSDKREMKTALWGQTCDSADCVYEDMLWPKISMGDILTIRKFSAYTYSPTSFFNGFAHHQVFVVNEEEDAEF
jgi:ornithine decarboxylase